MNLFETFINSPLRLKIADLLSTILIDNKFVLIDTWFFIHILSSVLATAILLRTKLSKNMIFFYVFFGAIVYEVIEWFFYTKWIPALFIPELGINIVWDLIASAIGIGLVLWFSKK